MGIAEDILNDAGIQAAPQNQGDAQPSPIDKFDATKSYGTPDQLLDNLKQIESSGNPKIINEMSGAQGAYQFLPDTVKMLKNQGVNFDPFDAKQSRAAADYYIQQLVKQKGGDYKKALAAYGGFKNADSTNYVNKALEGVDLAQQGNNTSVLGGPAPPVSNLPNSTQVNLPPLTGLGASILADAKAPPIPQKLASEDKIVQVASEFSPMNQAKAIGETALQMGTGTLASASGGIKGLYDLASGQGLDKAAQDIQNIQSKYTYQPRTTYGQALSGGINQAFNTANNLVGKVGGTIGGAVGGDIGRLRGESLGQIALPVASTLLGGASALKGASGLSLDNLSKGFPTLEDMKNLGNKAKAPPAMDAAKPHFVMHADGSIVPAESAPMLNTISDSAPLSQAIEQTKNALTQNRPDLSPVQIQRHAEASNLPIPLQLTDAQASGDVNLISKEMNTRGKYPQIANTLNAQNDTLVDNLNYLKAKNAPDIQGNPTDIGQNLVDAYKQKDAQLRQDIAGKYQQVVNANAGSFPIDVKQFLTNADNALAAKNISDFVPDKVKSLLNTYRQNPSMTFDQFMNTDKILGQQARAAARSSEGKTAQMAINIINDELNKVPATSDITAPAFQLLQDARATAKQRFDAIKTDPAYKAIINEQDDVPIGESSPLADNFVRNYIANGKTANVSNMINNIGDIPLAQKAIKAGYLDHIRQNSGIDLRTNAGNITQSGLNKTIQAAGNKSKLILGNDADTLNAIGNVAKYTQEQPRGSYVNNSNTLVGSLADLTQHGIETGLNVKTMGSYGLAKGIMQTLMRNRKPPSNVTLKDLGK